MRINHILQTKEIIDFVENFKCEPIEVKFGSPSKMNDSRIISTIQNGVLFHSTFFKLKKYHSLHFYTIDKINYGIKFTTNDCSFNKNKFFKDDVKDSLQSILIDVRLKDIQYTINVIKTMIDVIGIKNLVLNDMPDLFKFIIFHDNFKEFTNIHTMKDVDLYDSFQRIYC